MAHGKIPTMIILCGKCGIITKSQVINSLSIIRAKKTAKDHARECERLQRGETVDIYRLESSAFKGEL